MIKNSAGQRVGCQMVSATDGSAFTGSVTASVTLDAGTQATGSVGSGACTHEGNGYHTYAPSQAETNGDLVAFTFTGSGAIPVTVQVYTRAGDAFTRLGAPAGASVSADIAAVKAETASILTDTAETGAAGAGLTALATASALATVDANVDAILVDTGTDIPATLATIAAYVDTEVAAILAAVDTEVAAIKAVTDNLPDSGALTSLATAASIAALNDFDPATDTVTLADGGITSAKIGAGAVDAAALATDAVTEIADGLLNRNLASGTDSGSETVRTVRQALRALRNKVSIAAGVLTVTKENDTDASWTAAVTTTAGDPISSLDPTST